MMPSTFFLVASLTAASSEILMRSVSSAVTTSLCIFILSSSQKAGTSTLATATFLAAAGLGPPAGAASAGPWRQSISEPWANSDGATLETHCFSPGLSSASAPSSTRMIFTHWEFGCSTIRTLF